MAKAGKKGKSPKRPQGSRKFDENALEHLTSQIDQNLKGGRDQKRKNPPGSDSTSRDSKRQRSSSGAPKSAPKDDTELLLAEIKALGGDEKDLDLIKDVNSDDEELANEQKQSVDKSLKDEILAFSKSLGFAEYQPSEASEEEAEADQDDGGEAEEDDEDSLVSDEEKEVNEEDEDEDDEEEQDPPPKKIGNMTFDPRADWHATKLPKLPGVSSDIVAPFMGAIDSLKIHAKSLLEQDSAKYRTSFFASASHKFLSTIMTSGTLNDKVSALTLAIQESPVHNIRAFDGLFGLASKRSRAQAIGAIGALVDLLGPGTILPPDRRLRQFSSQPGLIGTLQRASVKSWQPGQPYPGKINENHLIYWAYEDWLKETYFKVIQLLENWCSDEIEYSRSRALDFVYGLLKEKPEQEANLLRLLVNKLGDRERKISSRASYLLLQLQTSHPGMKPVIIRAIEQDVLLHPSQDHRSKYSAINTLNQTILSSKEPTVAEGLMRVYFELFVALLKAGSLGIGRQDESEKDAKTPGGKPKGKPAGPHGDKKPSAQEVETADKLVSAILTGVNRAAPFVGANDTVMEKHLDTLFRIAHSSNFNTGIQALLLIQHLSSARSLGTDRFYRTLYESLLDPRLVSSSKQALYLNLLLRALKNDVDVRRVKAFAKRMLQVASLHQPPFVCGLLYVIAHLKGTFPDLPTLIQEPEESIFDDGSSENRPVYDGRKRDPEHSNAQRSCLWEIVPVQGHYHPSVSVYAAAIIDQDHKIQKPDLDSHTLIKFLDKFVYRSPKATDTSRGTSLMQPLNATKDVGDIWLGRAAGAVGPSVNSAAFWNKKVEDVAAEDVFFHEYFQHVTKDPKRPSKKVAKEDGSDEDVEEDEIWKALVSAQPDVDGGDGGSDVGFDDLDEDEMASSDDDESPDLDLEDDDLDEEMGDLDDEVDIEGSDEDGLVAIEEDEDGITINDSKEEKDKRKSRRKQLKDLPMFASVDDYAELLAQEEDDF
ncbi:unnamed protein product [Clonostachys byssicola]|uniref:CCAAT-binding factor domain-containing protein n=1 Tax=Clonostachys byssicola TaxID=160290 RepID=A0A9N9UWR1_9HYPO|nr:unnamed protein product [Clonostachys byssicola]